MSVLLATAMLLIGTGGYIACSLKEEKKKMKQSQKAIHRQYCAEAESGGPTLMGNPGTFAVKKQDSGCGYPDPSLLDKRTHFAYSIKKQDTNQPELLCRENFEAKRKTA